MKFITIIENKILLLNKKVKKKSTKKKGLLSF